MKQEFKVVICGSRGFENYEVLKEFCDKILVNKAKTHEIVIVSGTAKGADTLGERYAKERGYKCVRMPAEWDKYGQKAGYLRNEEMLKIADGVIAFWKSNSPGTAHMIKITKETGKKCAVYKED